MWCSPPRLTNPRRPRLRLRTASARPPGEWRASPASSFWVRLTPGTVIGHLGGVEGSRGARRFAAGWLCGVRPRGSPTPGGLVSDCASPRLGPPGEWRASPASSFWVRLAPGTVIGHLGGVEGSRGARRFGVDGYVVFAPAAHRPPAASSPMAHRLGSGPRASDARPRRARSG